MVGLLDNELIRSARRLITGANVHRVNSMIFLYRFSKVNSGKRPEYEKALKDFISQSRSNRGIRAR